MDDEIIETTEVIQEAIVQDNKAGVAEEIAEELRDKALEAESKAFTSDTPVSDSEWQKINAHWEAYWTAHDKAQEEREAADKLHRESVLASLETITNAIGEIRQCQSEVTSKIQTLTSRETAEIPQLATITETLTKIEARVMELPTETPQAVVSTSPPQTPAPSDVADPPSPVPKRQEPQRVGHGRKWL